MGERISQLQVHTRVIKEYVRRGNLAAIDPMRDLILREAFNQAIRLDEMAKELRDKAPTEVIEDIVAHSDFCLDVAEMYEPNSQHYQALMEKARANSESGRS